ncbi:hypothetical protein ACH5RR_025563 [Cinchona calisaya]|uniref:Uncharacterized protein n=1 Tax=Cinchona calisaya TaxID=153742 RepID=A0ABD2Z1X4_9GENT
MASHEETLRKLEVEFDVDWAEGPFDMYDDGHESDDPNLNPSSAYREKDLEEYFVTMSKIGVPTFEGGIDLDKADKWFGQIKKIRVLLKISKLLKLQEVTHFLERNAKT